MKTKLYGALFLGIPLLAIVGVLSYSYFDFNYQAKESHDKIVSDYKQGREISSMKKP